MANKDSIYLALLTLAAEKGLGAVSMAQTAEKAGIQKATLYSHFSSKEEMIDGLYGFLREKSKEKLNIGAFDYGAFVKGKKPLDVLKAIISSYKKMNSDENISVFYKLVLSERRLNKEAAKIMVAETEQMLKATKQLFYAMQVHRLLEFENADAAAFSFAMTVHSALDYAGDLEMAGNSADNSLDEYLADFCRLYRVKEDTENA